ncbi:PHD finger protein 12 [Battus philenor]|uniref:PHD finger protein 12 n=1 Tax=Battus philenor TaxID=42288 RepID=UPI0035CF420D
MSNVGYDLDTSGGLMPLIRALIKPPDEDLNTQKPKKPQHPYYKRPGKGHNHDSCDACGEGGDLICCDRCPASFHLGCYDPPLDESDIPAGLWLCRECRAADERQSTSRGSRAQSPVDKSDNDKKSRSLRNSRANSSTKKKNKEDDKEPEEEEEKKELSPMEILVKAAKIMNPKQFELPREMKIPCIFPGTEKEGSKNGSASVVTVDAWGCVPLPAKSCFVCRGTCKSAPLLQCDYCPLLFHQDCLDPPLTALPTGRWMCPNHVEQYIDWKLVNSISATERVALWDKFSAPVDQHAIKIDFIRRARRARPAFRLKASGMRGRVIVPEMVRQHYRHPPPLLPSRREHVRCTAVMKRLKASGDYSESEDEEAGRGDTKRQICLNTSCPQYSGEGACPLRAASEDDAADDLEAITQPKEEKGESSSELSDSDFEYLTSKVKRRRVSGDKWARGRSARPDRLQLRADEDVEQLLATVEEQLHKLDERLVKLLAWQQLQQIACGEARAGRWRGCGASAPTGGAAGARWLRGVDRARLARLGVRRAALPSELLARADRERIARLVWGSPPAAAQPSPRVSLQPAVPVRATLCPVKPDRHGGEAAIGTPIAMRLSSATVGTHGCDVPLPPRCRRAAQHHAVIFCDEVTGHFELINYSEWGSRVNGVLYTCDASPRDEQPPQPDASPDAQQEAEARAAALRDFVRRRRPAPQRLNGSLTTRPSWEQEECQCPSWSPSGEGAWEGSALLAHGALLQFGCCLYVFSIAQPEDEP